MKNFSWHCEIKLITVKFSGFSGLICSKFLSIHLRSFSSLLCNDDKTTYLTFQANFLLIWYQLYPNIYLPPRRIELWEIIFLIEVKVFFIIVLQVDVDYIEDSISISSYPLSAALACAKICSAFEEKWNVVWPWLSRSFHYALLEGVCLSVMQCALILRFNLEKKSTLGYQSSPDIPVPHFFPPIQVTQEKLECLTLNLLKC